MAKYTPVKSGIEIVKEIREKYAKKVKYNYNLIDINKRISDIEEFVNKAKELGKI